MGRVLMVVAVMVATGCAGMEVQQTTEEHPGDARAATGALPEVGGTLSASAQTTIDSDEVHGSHGEAAVYVCPMHPEVVSGDPAARCPKCGMKLEPKAEASK